MPPPLPAGRATPAPPPRAPTPPPAAPQPYAQPQQYAQQPQYAQPPQQYVQQPQPQQYPPPAQQPPYVPQPAQGQRPPPPAQARPQPPPPPAAGRPAPPKPPPAAGAPAASAAPMVNANQELVAGTTICSRYKVERILGRGGMGAVYAVRHVNTGEQLALKILHPSLAANAQAVERFRTEARAPVRIGTDHVVRVVDADVSPELGDVPILVMELLEGRDLGTELKRRGALPAGEVVLYLRQVARALDKAHGLGIIHRDLKPANLYLTARDDGTPLVKILDFGIAKLADGVSGELTQDGTIFGTPWYMSPEQARGQASKVGPSIDLWALGLIAFRLLTGRNYWTAEGMAALIGQICYDPMPPPSQMAPHLGPRFDEWFARACNREVEKRFTSATEEVLKLAEALGVSAAPQMTGQLDASQFPGGYSMGGAPGGMSQSGGMMPGMSASGAPAPHGMSMSATPMSHQGLSMSATPMSASGAPMPQGLSQSGGMPAANLSTSGAPISSSQGGSTAAPLTATPFSAPVKQGNGTAIFMGLLVAVLVAGAATAGWLLIGHKKPPPVTAAAGEAPTAAPTVSATAAPTATVVAAPTAVATAIPTATAAEPPPTPTAEPTAAPTATAVAAAPSTAPTTAKIGGPVVATGPKPPPGATSAKQPPKIAPKVDKIKF